ncbi:hypothetical protein HYFRA_00007115 [Hymenoscyphus fraxineus]|uniref:Uncharacterized protein n=1 Tax=Hymenoscyphus fraxineus TaxID=746836 RepID=A0A9N9PTE0_9HELO|nr:hypothetical protein HYFRA_00007115 [Hymenoscyphus fraxineus]
MTITEVPKPFQPSNILAVQLPILAKPRSKVLKYVQLPKVWVKMKKKVRLRSKEREYRLKLCLNLEFSIRIISKPASFSPSRGPKVDPDNDFRQYMHWDEHFILTLEPYLRFAQKKELNRKGICGGLEERDSDSVDQKAKLNCAIYSCASVVYCANESYEDCGFVYRRGGGEYG